MFAAAALIARKDLAIDFRTRSAFLSAIVFSLLAIAIFYFAWDATAVSSVDLAPGVLWVIFTFSGILGLHRSFGVEEADRAIDACSSRPWIEKPFSWQGTRESRIRARRAGAGHPGGRALLQSSARASLRSRHRHRGAGGNRSVAVGTLFSSMAANTRLAELLLPVLSLPFFVPISASGCSVHRASSRASERGGNGLVENPHRVRHRVRGGVALAFPFTLED
jgi:heme exporter protein B